MLFDFWRLVFSFEPSHFAPRRANPPPLVSKENGPSGGAATGAVFSSDAPRGDAAPGSEDQRTLAACVPRG